MLLLIYILKKKTTKNIISCQEFPLIFHNESWRVCKSWPHKKKLHRMNFSFTRKMEEIWVCLDAWVFLNCSLSAVLLQWGGLSLAGNVWTKQWSLQSKRTTITAQANWVREHQEQQSKLVFRRRNGLGTPAAWLFSGFCCWGGGSNRGKSCKSFEGGEGYALLLFMVGLWRVLESAGKWLCFGAVEKIKINAKGGIIWRKGKQIKRNLYGTVPGRYALRQNCLPRPEERRLQ